MNCLNGYEEMLLNAGKSGNTVRSYLSAVRGWNRFISGLKHGQTDLKVFNPFHFSAFKFFLLKKRGLKASTINTYLSALSSYCDYLIANEYLLANPVKEIKRVFPNKSCRGHEPHVNVSHIDGVMHYLHNNCRTPKHLRNRCITGMVYIAGITVKEVNQLRTDDVIFLEEKLTAFYTGCGDQRRLVVIHDQRLCEILWIHMQIRRLQLGDYLFMGNKANVPYRQSSIYGLLKRSFARAGVPYVPAKTMQYAYQKNSFMNYNPPAKPAAKATP